MSQIPLPESDNIKVTTYADDITLTTPGPNIESLADNMNPYLNSLNTWLAGRNFSLSKDKLTTSIFSTWMNEFNLEPKVMVDGTNLPTTRNPKVLRVTFDNQLNLNKHCTKTCDKLRKRNNVLKKLAGTTSGCSKETLSVTYKVIGGSVQNYAAPIWNPHLATPISNVYK